MVRCCHPTRCRGEHVLPAHARADEVASRCSDKIAPGIAPNHDPEHVLSRVDMGTMERHQRRLVVRQCA